MKTKYKLGMLVQAGPPGDEENIYGEITEVVLTNSGVEYKLDTGTRVMEEDVRNAYRPLAKVKARIIKGKTRKNKSGQPALTQ